MHSPTTIHHLAHETLSEIFGFLHGKGLYLSYSPLYPWTLSLVCKTWRNVVLSTPRLWTNIRVGDAPIRIDVRLNAMLAALELCLGRSKGCPLTVHLEARTERTRQLIPRFLKPCFEHCERWKHITFLFPVALLVPFLQDSKRQHHYPQLQSLSLYGLDETKDSDWEALSDTPFFHNAPRLSIARFVGLSWRLPNLDIPWSNITDFASDMNFSGAAQFLDVLRRMPNLVSLEYAHYGNDCTPDVSRLRTVELLHLRKLSLSTHYFNLSSIFDVLHTPLLTGLDIHCTDSRWTDSFDAFLKRSQCTMTDVYLRHVPVDVASTLLSILPSCEVLKLEIIDLNRQLLDRLTCDASSQPPTPPPPFFVPRLKELHLTNATIERGMERYLIDMVESRLRGPDNAASDDGLWSRLELLHVGRLTFPGEPKIDYALSVFDVLKDHTWSDSSFHVLFRKGSGTTEMVWLYYLGR